jgi:hypothetical protein
LRFALLVYWRHTEDFSMTEKEPTPLIAVRMPAELLAEVDRLARTRYVSRSDVVRDAVRTLVRGHPPWPPHDNAEEAA